MFMGAFSGLYGNWNIKKKILETAKNYKGQQIC